MRFNPECVRDILIYAENRSDGFHRFGFSQDDPLLSKYDNVEINYHVNQCVENGLFLDVKKYLYEGIVVKDLSPKGHDFLASIRNNTVWQKIKRNAPASILKMIELVAQIVPLFL